ncbi:MAG: hypothetical protein JWP97_5423 [Labilithrix sp.]|nr:hypothetical protein [Labilithrix sp.]
MRLAARLLLPVLCSALASCLPDARSSPSRAADGWQRLDTEHFALTTNLPPDAALVAARSLEATRAALLTAAWNRADDRITQRTSVVVLRDQNDFEHYASRRYAALYTSAVRPTIFLHGTPEHWEQRTATTDESTTSVLRHELTHRLSAGIYGRQPRWFAEGLAQFLETLAVAPDGRSAILGRVNLVALDAYRRSHASVAELLAWHSDVGVDDGTLRALYGTSFVFVHYLYYTKPNELAAYQTKLATGAEPDRAFAECFRGTRPEELDKELDHYSRFGKFTDVVRPLRETPVTPATGPVTPADVLAIRAQLASVGAGWRAGPLLDEARQDVRDALELEPGNTLALRLQGIQEHAVPKDAVARLRRQVAQRPSDADAWLLLGEALGDDQHRAREAALRKSLALRPRDPDALDALAWELVSTGRAEAALPLATKATLLAPWSAAAYDAYAAALHGVGRCKDALTAQRRAVDLLPEDTGRAIAEAYVKKVAEYDAACSNAASP